MALLKNIKERLQEEGIACLEAFPNRRMPRLLQPTVMLCITERKFEPSCHGNFFGRKGDSLVYVHRCCETLTCEVYSPYLSGGAQCDSLADAVFVRISDTLPEGVVRSIVRTPTYYDPDTDCFRASVVICSDGWVLSSMVRGDA